MKTIKDAITDRELLLLLALASKVCGEKNPNPNPLITKQINRLREEVAKILTKFDIDSPGIIVNPSDGKPWKKRNGKAK